MIDPLVFARALAAVATLPIGGVGARIAIGLVLAGALAALRPVEAPPSAGALLTAAANGALLGFIAGLPVRALGAIGGRPGLGHYGRAAGWALFFAAGGPAWWVAGLVAADPAAGRAWFTAVLLLGLPVWITEAGLLPVAGWLERVGARGARRLWPARGPLLLLAVLVWLPALLGWLDPIWRAALGG
ncbi:MAG: hypothetical protein H6701_03320 [Myxococcales bacterium]|nr:hypothetical protein [Myxococcales bacterium]